MLVADVARAPSVAAALAAGWMQREIERIENAAERDPALAIGTAKDRVETCCCQSAGCRSLDYMQGLR